MRFPEFSGEWEKCTIGELTIKVGSGVTPRGGEAVYKTEGHPFVRSQNVGLGQLLLDDIAYIDEDTHQRQKNTELQLDDVLLNITGASIGRSAMATKEIVGGNVNQHVCIIRTQDNLISSFLCNFLLSSYGQKQIDSFQAGGNRQGLNFEQIKSIKITIPTVNEQCKIAQLLQLVEDRISTQNKIIEDLKKLKSAIAQKLLNDRVLLETRISLGEVCELKNGYAFKSSSYCRDGKYKIITIANVQGNRYISTEDCKTISYLPKDLQKHQVLRENDILISMTGNVGRVSLCNDGHYLLNQRVGLLAPKIKEVEFLFQVLASEHFEQSMIACGQGAAQMNIGKSDIDGYMLPFSRKSDNMNHIAKVLLAYDNCTNTNVKLLDYLILQKQYLLSQMFI